MKCRQFLTALLLLSYLLPITGKLSAEPLRIMLAGTHIISSENPEGSITSISYTDSTAIILDGDLRFLRGIQLDLTAPQSYLLQRGGLAAVFYMELDNVPPIGAADVTARQISMEALPVKILNTWQIPLKPSHGLRSSPYITIPANIVPPSSFPILFRLMPVIKGISEEMEKMIFQLQVKPILSNEGILKINFIYPEKLPNKPLIVLIDDVITENPWDEFLINQGEHNLVILSDYYRNFSSKFIIEKAKINELTIEMQDPTPLLIFEYPENTRIYVDNVRVTTPEKAFPVEPGQHEIRFQISDYSIVQLVTVQMGKTYKIALSVDVNIKESD